MGEVWAGLEPCLHGTANPDRFRLVSGYKSTRV